MSVWMWNERFLPVPLICASVPIAAGTGQLTLPSHGAYARNRIATWPGDRPIVGSYGRYISDCPCPIGIFACIARLIGVPPQSAVIWVWLRDVFATKTVKHASCGGPEAASMSIA